LILALASLALKVGKQYEHGVLFRLGRVIGVRQAGLTMIVPFVDVLHRVSLRIVAMPIQSQGIIKDIQLPESMKRAMARQAEAEREKRAKIIAAEGEALAGDALGDAADGSLRRRVVTGRRLTGSGLHR
jgi:regulator of protease activity HflC (stomatin/prohibitin superfamily)